MKRFAHTTLAPLAILFLGTTVLAPASAATSEDNLKSQASAPAYPESMVPTTAGAPEQITPSKSQVVCARLDKDKDGYLSKNEFKGAKKTSDIFKTADANKDGRLDMKECEKTQQTS